MGKEKMAYPISSCMVYVLKDHGLHYSTLHYITLHWLVISHFCPRFPTRTAGFLGSDGSLKSPPPRSKSSLQPAIEFTNQCWTFRGFLGGGVAGFYSDRIGLIATIIRCCFWLINGWDLLHTTKQGRLWCLFFISGTGWLAGWLVLFLIIFLYHCFMALWRFGWSGIWQAAKGWSDLIWNAWLGFYVLL